MADVQLKSISKIYDGNVKAVDEISLSVRDREFMVLVGPSGCGKSTTLRMIAGLEEISAGEIHIGERVVNTVEPKDRDIAMVFQNYALYPHMSVFDNMAFGLKLRKYPKAEIKTRVDNAAEILGLQDYLDRRPKALSGGQRQRVAVGRAIVRQPAVFLFDEPLSNLDAKMRVQMRSEISRLHRRLDATMIYVTHDQVEAMTMGDRICVMKDGVIQQVAEPLELYTNPANRFVASFIGTPPMSFIDGRIEKSGGSTHFVAEGVRLSIDGDALDGHAGKSVTFGIRPEDLGSDTAERLDRAPKISGQVDDLEPMGSETYGQVSLAGAALTARFEPHRRVAVGDRVELAVNMAKARFFDADNGLRIG